MKLLSLENKVIVITGGHGHLGTAISKGLGELGAKVVVLGRNKETFSEKFDQTTLSISFEEVDIASSQKTAEVFSKVFEKYGRIDVLINNACYISGNDPAHITDEEWEYSMEGVLGTLHRCIREIVPYFKRQGFGKIINVSSMYGMVSPDWRMYEGFTSYTNPPHYGAAKAGVLQLTRYFACFLGKDNILVNAVSPGPFPSEKVQKDEEFIVALSKKNPLGRIGKPEELVGVFVLLSSDASSFITGQNFVVDGGWTAW